ncbi:MAG TPA: SDR family NAD(P)-dependent oxidoreductase, partial [Verrucomicrobiae bacterium]|nr:SDR family NAD(P)-dependent oxidoreductase [Verrucomicrobiae bacterium]
METGLKGKVIIVTGASGGIGWAIARKFAEEGARVVAHYRRHRAQAEALELPDEQSLLVGADLTKEAAVRRLFEAAVKRFGRVDTLVANAGSWETRDVLLQEMSLSQWRNTLDAV